MAVDIGENRGKYSSYNVAKRVIAFSTRIPRADLRPGSGDGLLGAPRRAGLPWSLPSVREAGDRRGPSSLPTQHDARRARHVCTEPAEPGLCGPGV
jgi:hypothetical protein